MVRVGVGIGVRVRVTFDGDGRKHGVRDVQLQQQRPQNMRHLSTGRLVFDFLSGTEGSYIRATFRRAGLSLAVGQQVTQSVIVVAANR